jgi:hypothetical protein
LFLPLQFLVRSWLHGWCNLDRTSRFSS